MVDILKTTVITSLNELILFELQEYFKLLKPLHLKGFRNLIVTCEDAEVVEEMSLLGKKRGWKVIRNEFDVMQGTGSANGYK